MPTPILTRHRRTVAVALLLVALLLTLTVPSAVAQDTAQPATVLRNANLRTGPGTTYALAGSARAGASVTIVGQNAAGDWYELDGGQWIAAFLVRVDAAASAPPAGAVAAQVVRITDGDTIRVRIAGAEVPVRYILINTPETDQPFGAEATAANRRLVEGQTVYLLKDVSETDRFNRLLRYVFLADGTHVNAALLRQGYAQVATFPPDVSREAEMWAAGASAAPSAPQRSGEGVVVPAATPAPTPSGGGGSQWPAYTCTENPSPPPDPACPIKGNISSGGQIFHVPGQRDYCRTVIDLSKGERWFCSEAEAVAAGWRAALR
jgi:micrococcal nuclease